MSLIEVIVFMLILSIAVGATMSLFANANRGSAQMLADRQAQAIAESILNEVMAAPFTYCDPTDANFSTAASPATCASMPETLPGGPEAGETRLGPSRYDNVNDYNGFTMGPGIIDQSGLLVSGLDAFSLSVGIAPVVAVGNWNGIPGTEMAVITVTVTAPTLTAPVVLQGMRARYAPKTPPL